ncbi:hypothetical protein JCM16358_05380 [Halanaerocella petrolearia]
MKIVCLGYYQSGTALLVASSYLKLWEEGVNSKLQSIFNSFNQQEETGEVLSLGIDRQGNEVLVLGCQGQEAIISRMIRGFKSVFALEEEIILINTTSADDLFIKYGVKLNRLGWKRVGEQLMKIGVKRSHSSIRKLVTRIEERTASLK